MVVELTYRVLPVVESVVVVTLVFTGGIVVEGDVLAVVLPDVPLAAPVIVAEEVFVNMVELILKLVVTEENWKDEVVDAVVLDKVVKEVKVVKVVDNVDVTDELK